MLKNKAAYGRQRQIAALLKTGGGAFVNMATPWGPTTPPAW